MIDETGDDPLHLGSDPTTLLGKMEELEGVLGDFRAPLARANRTARRAKVVGVAGVVVAVIGVVIGIGGWRAQQDAIRSRDEARKAMCVQENRQAKAESAKLVNGLKAFFDDPANPSAEEQAALDVYAEATKPEYRDCSSAGIKAYIENPPSDPALD